MLMTIKKKEETARVGVTLQSAHRRTHSSARVAISSVPSSHVKKKLRPSGISLEREEWTNIRGGVGERRHDERCDETRRARVNTARSQQRKHVHTQKKKTARERKKNAQILDGRALARDQCDQGITLWDGPWLSQPPQPLLLHGHIGALVLAGERKRERTRADPRQREHTHRA